MAQPLAAQVDAKGTLYVDNLGFYQATSGCRRKRGRLSQGGGFRHRRTSCNRALPGPISIALIREAGSCALAGTTISVVRCGRNETRSTRSPRVAAAYFLAFDKQGNLHASTLATSILVYGSNWKPSAPTDCSRHGRPERGLYLRCDRAISTRVIYPWAQATALLPSTRAEHRISYTENAERRQPRAFSIAVGP